MVLFALRAAEGQWRAAGYCLIPILSFVMGVLVAELIRNRQKAAGRFHWRHTVLGIEILTLAAASFVPSGEWNPVVNIAVSFVCAMQVDSFRKVRGYPFASTMCTGNLRSGTDALFYAVKRRSGALLRKSLCYYGIITLFIGGAALGAAVAPHLPQRAVLIAAGLQLAAFLLMMGEDE